MPHLGGLELMNRLHDEEVDIPIIIVTADDTAETILQTFRLGAKDFLAKPFKTTEVQAALEKALVEERLRRDKERLTESLIDANERLKQQLDNWIALNDIAQAISSTLKEREVMRRVMANVQRILQVEAGSLLLRNPNTGELYFAITLKGDAARFAKLRIPEGKGIAGWVAQHDEPLLVPDVEADPRFLAHIDRITGFKSRSVICVPLRVRDQVIGVMEVINKQSDSQYVDFTDEDLTLMETLASWVAIALENARLTHSIRKIATTQGLKQAVTTLAHHINNQLQALTLEVDALEENPPDPEFLSALVDSVHGYIQQITAVIRALDRLEEIHTVPYTGTTKMIDIESALAEELRRLEAEG
jgi:two-component system NtrC family sensor kinase